MNGLEAPPAIIMGECFSSFSQSEIAHYHLIGLAKPVEEDALVRAIDQLLV
jgi:hypothetical protein